MKFIQRRLEPLYAERSDLVAKLGAARTTRAYLRSAHRRFDVKTCPEAQAKNAELIALLTAKHTALEIRIAFWEGLRNLLSKISFA